MPPESARPPAPRRILLDPTGWTLVREGGEAAGLTVAALPDTGEVVAQRADTRQRLVATGVLREDGRPTEAVHAALAVLTTARVTVTVERRQPGLGVAASWRTLGAPTAGLVVRAGDAGDEAGSATDGGPRRGVELQLLAIDDLVDTVVTELLGDGAAADPAVDPADHVDVEADADDPAAWPDGVVVDGDIVAQASVVVDGPGGTSTAQLWGDGRRWWQVGASAPDRVRGVAVTRDTVHATLAATLAGQLDGAAADGGTTGGADRG